jgi:AraC-like DNA-binding protein
MNSIIDQVFRGEACTFPNFPAPIQDVLDRGVIDEKPWEAAIMDLLMVPYWYGGVFQYTVCFFDIKQIYKGKPEIAKAQEYIRLHWIEDLDPDKVAEAANMSRRNLQRLLKDGKHEKLSDFYKRIKIKRLKEKILDPKLNITEAFAACGIAGSGRWYDVFKKETGLTPIEYRKQYIKI